MSRSDAKTIYEIRGSPLMTSREKGEGVKDSVTTAKKRDDGG